MGRIPFRRSLLAPRVVVVLAGAACSQRDVSAPRPGQLADGAIAMPAMSPSVISGDVRLELSDALSLLEQTVPRHFGDIDRPVPVPGKDRSSFAYHVRRDPFTIAVGNEAIQLASTVHYRAKGWYDPPLAPAISGSCGNDETVPRARLSFSVRAELTPDWKLKTRTRLTDVRPLTEEDRDRCVVSFLRLDMTRNVMNAVRTVLVRELPRVDRLLAGQDVRGAFAPIWDKLQHPIRITDSMWLLVQPQAVSVSPLRRGPGGLLLTVAITASPRIETGTEPRIPSTPLPPVTRAAADSGLDVEVRGRFEYPVIQRMLAETLRGERFILGTSTFVIRDIEVLGLGGGKMALGVTFGGTLRGIIYFVGSPIYDTTRHQITIPDLDFDASSASLLVRGIAWLKSSDIVEFLREHATFPAGPLLSELEGIIAGALNRDLAPGVRLAAAISGTRVTGLAPRTDALYVLGRVLGTARLELSEDIAR